MDSAYQLLDEQSYPTEMDDAGQPAGMRLDLAEAVLKRAPRSDLAQGLWYFSAMPHTAISVDKYLRCPRIGHWTLENPETNEHTALLDRLPEGAIVATTLTVQPQDDQEVNLQLIEHAAIGNTARAAQASTEAREALHEVARGRKLYAAQQQVYLRADDDTALRVARVRALTALRAAHLDPIESEGDLVQLDTYVRNLPMAYNPKYEKDLWRHRRQWDKQLANLLPLYGSGVGTGNPGLVFLNREGEPLMLDPLLRRDRTNNSHGVVIGPTGSGKSALLNYMIASWMAIHEPYLVIIDVGGSFKLMGEYLASFGYRVNQVRITPNADVSLPPFAEAIKVLDEYTGADDRAVPSGDEERDILGEMEIAAKYMITGGEESELARFHREDIMTVRHALFNAAASVRAAGGEQVMVQDVVAALRRLSDGEQCTVGGETLNVEPRRRSSQMADAMNVFATGLGARFFNRPGKLWPESDVTIVDLGHLARDSYTDARTMVYMGLMNRLNDQIEARRGKGRQTVVVMDEAHITLRNALMADYTVTATKTWRKLGTWLWVATQNLSDFPGPGPGRAQHDGVVVLSESPARGNRAARSLREIDRRREKPARERPPRRGRALRRGCDPVEKGPHLVSQRATGAVSGPRPDRGRRIRRKKAPHGRARPAPSSKPPSASLVISTDDGAARENLA